MDRVIDARVAREQFSYLFAQCDECYTCLPRQNIFYHNCDQARAQHQTVLSHTGDREYLLQAETCGLPVDRFSALFVNCQTCDKFMTRDTSRFHDCIIEQQLL
jgi:hypothetical protein